MRRHRRAPLPIWETFQATIPRPAVYHSLGLYLLMCIYNVSCSGPSSDPVVTLAALPLISRAVSRLHFAPCCSDYCTSITIAVRHVRTLSPGLNIIDPPRAPSRNALWARTGRHPSCFMIEPFGLILRHSPARLLIAIFAARLSTGRTSLGCQ